MRYVGCRELAVAGRKELRYGTALWKAPEG